MRRKLAVVAAGLVASGVPFPAGALVITPSSPVEASGLSVGQTKQVGQAKIDTFIAPYLGSATELYKQNFSGAEEGSLSSSYTTTFSGTPGDPSGALVEYDGGSFIGSTSFLLIKDGNHQPWWYLFDLTGLGWNGTDDVVLENFWPAGGSISHITFYGTPATPPPSSSVSIPDSGASGWLLAAGLFALGMARRFVR